MATFCFSTKQNFVQNHENSVPSYLLKRIPVHFGNYCHTKPMFFITKLQIFLLFILFDEKCVQ